MSEQWEPSLGAIVGDAGVRFTVWAPLPSSVSLLLGEMPDTRDIPMERDRNGCWSALVPLDEARAGQRYGYILDGDGPFPDPCSRSQPNGPDGLSAVVDPRAFSWRDRDFVPPEMTELVIYELHIGTFTVAGTFDAAIEHLPALRELGIRAIEVMPVAEFAGTHNWGYDGVALFAPASVYGGPDGLRRLVDAAHRAGLAVILDVVYNHFGPAGNYTGRFSAEYLDPALATPWGAAINFASPQVRTFYTENLLHWMHEYHVDGFRFDATSRIIDQSSGEHILASLSREAERFARSTGRPYLIAETHENDAIYFRPRDSGGRGFDAVWADDFHHIVRVLLTGDRDGYFSNYAGTAHELAATVSEGFLAEREEGKAKGGTTRAGRAGVASWSTFVYCLQNHDQIGNRAFGDRLTLTASHADMRAATMLLLLLPQVPLLFQGQEYFATTPFQYFTSHEPELGARVTEGRRMEFSSFGAFSDSDIRAAIPDPQHAATFARSRLHRDEASAGIGRIALEFHRAILELRADDPILAEVRHAHLPLHVAVTGRALLIRFEAPAGRRWLGVNLGETVTFSVEVPVHANLVVHSEEARFGGNGALPTWSCSVVGLPRHTAAFFAERPQ